MFKQPITKLCSLEILKFAKKSKGGISEKYLQMRNNQEESGFASFRNREAPESDNKSENHIRWICEV